MTGEQLPNNRTNFTNSGIWDIKYGTSEISRHKQPTYPIIFIFSVAFLGAIVRTILINCKYKCLREFPYTVLMMLMGCVAGLIERVAPEHFEKYMAAAHLDAHAILTIFLPCLIFSSAFEMEMHIFYRAIVQVMVLAGPGTLLCTGATAGMIVLIWQWNTLCALLFGSIVSATDPVAVVSILHSAGAPSRLGVLIDGEALINDGAAIVLFTIFTKYEANQGFAGFLYFCMVIFVSPIIGFSSGYVATLCIGASYNDLITETVITIAVPYVIYILAEFHFQASGVLTVLVFGLTLSHNKTAFSPQVYPVVVHIWEYFTFLANTLIFFIVGVVIVKEIKEMTEVGGMTESLIGETITVYILVVAIRLVVIAILYPILQRTGYGVDWKTALVMLWGGLRGAVGLALALVVASSAENPYWHGVEHKVFDEGKQRDERILFWTIGIVFFTLIINATTTSALLKVLEFGKASVAKQINMNTALKKIEDTIHHKMGILTSDKFLAGADWQHVQKLVAFDNMYQGNNEDDNEDDDIFLDRKTTCPECNVMVQNNPSVNETKDMVEESRQRLLRLEGVSYLTQYEDGRILQHTTHELHSRTEELAELDEGYTCVEEVVNEHVVSSNLYAKRGIKIRRRSANPRRALVGEDLLHPVSDNKNLEKNVEEEENGAEEDVVEFQKSLSLSVSDDSSAGRDSGAVSGRRQLTKKKLGRLRGIVDGLPFEVFFLILILLNMINIGLEIDNNNKQSCNLLWLFCIDVGFLALYLIEFAMRLGAHGRDYMPRSFWGWLDCIIIVMGVVSVMGILIDPKWKGTPECAETKDDDDSDDGHQIKLVKVLKVLRIVRIFRIARFFMSEDSKFVQNMINTSYHTVMEVNAAVITAQDDIHDNIRQVPISVYKPINDITAARNQANRYVSKYKFAKFSAERPGVEISLRTRQATAVVVDSAMQRVNELFEMGFLEDKDLEVLQEILQKKKIMLKNAPTSLPVPDPSEALKIVPWLDGDEEAQTFVLAKGALHEFNKGHNLNQDGIYRGIFIIASGNVLIKGVQGLARQQAENWEESLAHVADDADRGWKPDTSGKWLDSLPRKLLIRLAKPKGVMAVVGHDSVEMHESRDEMLNAKFAFVSKGFVLNEINMVAPNVESTPKAICLSDVTAYFLSAEKVKEMLTKFSYRFQCLEASIWTSLACTHFRGKSEWPNKDMAFVIFIDNNHKLKSSGKIEFHMDYANIQNAVLLHGTARSSAMEEMVTGPYEMHHGELSLEFAPSKKPGEVVGVIFLVPNSGNDVHEMFSPDLETLRQYAAEWIRKQGFDGSMDDLLLRTIDHFDNSPPGSEDSTLYIAIKNRINQVIAATLKQSGKKITAKQVILEENPLLTAKSSAAMSTKSRLTMKVDANLLTNSSAAVNPKSRLTMKVDANLMNQ